MAEVFKVGDKGQGENWCTWWLETVEKGRRRNRKNMISRTGLRLPKQEELTSLIEK